MNIVARGTGMATIGHDCCGVRWKAQEFQWVEKEGAVEPGAGEVGSSHIREALSSLLRGWDFMLQSSWEKLIPWASDGPRFDFFFVTL